MEQQPPQDGGGGGVLVVAPAIPKRAVAPPTSLAPGFRFHPTDEELVRYYLRRKACGKPFRFQAVSEIDVYKSEPWELAGTFLFRFLCLRIFQFCIDSCL